MNQLSNEECLLKIPNRFELVLVAAHRAKELAYGSRAKTSKVGASVCVTALNEIEEGYIGRDYLFKLSRK